MSLDECIVLFGKCSRKMDALWYDVRLIQEKYFIVSIAGCVCVSLFVLTFTGI